MERVKSIPSFRKKHEDKNLQILYTCYNHLEIKKFGHVISDRSPLSDIWYEFCFSIINQDKTIDDFKEFINLDIARQLFSNYTTLFVIWEKNDIDCENDVFSMMLERNNELDLMQKKYLTTQNEIFHALRELNIANFHFFVKPCTVPMYSTEYYTMLHRNILKAFMSIDSLNPFYLNTVKCNDICYNE